MKKILSLLTRNPVMGALAGMLVTAVLQSSSATTVMAIGFVACQPTPEKEIVVHKAAEQLEATLVESEDKEADSTFICPSKLNEEIQMPHFRFVADTDIEIGQAEGFYVYEATQDRFGQTRMDEIVSYFSKDLIGARSGEITKEDLEELKTASRLRSV